VPNQHWPTYFIQPSQKNLFLQPHLNSKQHFPSGILNFCPKLKLYAVFKKSIEFQIQNLRIQLWSLQFSNFFAKVTHNIFKIFLGSVRFSSPMVLKGPFIVMFV
jgi:hypothetical protein